MYSRKTSHIAGSKNSPSLRLLAAPFFALAFLSGFVSCSNPTQRNAEAERFCDSLDVEFEAANSAIGGTLWRYMSRVESFDSLHQLRAMWFERLNSGGALARIDRLQNTVSDSLTLRRLAVSRKRILFDLLENDPEVSSIVDSLRSSALLEVRSSHSAFPELDSVAVPLLYQRRELYRALSADKRDLSSGILRVARLRNQRCQSLGYNSTLDLNLKLSGLTRDELNRTLAVIDSTTAGAYKRLLDRIGDTLSHHRLEEADLFYYETRILNRYRRNHTRGQALRFSLETVTKLGIDIRHKSLFIDSSSNWLMEPWLVAPHPPEDIRLMYATTSVKGNLKAADSDVEALLGRLGQGVRLLSCGDKPYLLRGSADPMWEMCCGGLFEELLGRRKLQRKFSRIRRGEYEAFANAFADARLLRLRRLLTLIYFELALYDNPNRELRQIYAEIVSETLHVKVDKRFQLWTSRSEFLLNPGTQFCRLYADLIGAQIYSSALREHGSLVNNPQFGAYLQKTYFEPGALLDWSEFLLLGTGEKLNLNYFLDQFENSASPN